MVLDTFAGFCVLGTCIGLPLRVPFASVSPLSEPSLSRQFRTQRGTAFRLDTVALGLN